MGVSGGPAARKAMLTNPAQLRKYVQRCMRKLLEKSLMTDDPKVQDQREIDFAWAMAEWRTFDPTSPMKAFPPGDGTNSKDPSALELLIILLKRSSSSDVHYACCASIAYLAVRPDVRSALVETPSGPLMESLDLFVRRLEATDSAGVRYALCAIASELCKGDAGLMRLRDINFAQALERLRQKRSMPKDPALEMIIDHLVHELRPRIA